MNYLKQLRNYLIVLFSLLYIPFSHAQDQNKKRGWEFFKENLNAPVNGRMDYRFLNYDENTDEFVKDSRFQFSALLLQVHGKISDQILFHYRQVYNSNTIGTANITDNIQVAKIDFTTSNKKWTFSGGKFFMNLGTVEQEYDPSDVYRYSIINNNLACWKTGVGALYTSTSGQNIGLQIVNGAQDSTGNQTALEYNLYWNGIISKDKIDIYTSATTLSSYNDNDSQPFAGAVGIQWFLGDFILDTDLAVSRNMPNLYKNARYISAPIKLQYFAGKFKPYVKFFYDQIEFDDGSRTTINPENGEEVIISNTSMYTGEIALEYYPWDDHNIRFHVVGSYASQANFHFTDDAQEIDPEARNHYISQYQLLIGCRFGFNALDPLHK